MTTQRDAPTLDRLITRVDTVPPGDLALRYTTRDDAVPPGTYYVGSGLQTTTLRLASVDADGVEIPETAAPTQIRVMGTGIFNSPFDFVESLASFTRSGEIWTATHASPGTFQNTNGGEINVSFTTTGGESVTRIWARRRDFVGRDLVELTGAGPLTIQDSRFDVRAGLTEWAVNDTFRDDEGATRTVVGISELGGRGRFLELLARRVG